MNKPLKPEQLELVPDQGEAAILAAAGLSPEQVARVEKIIAAPGPDGFDWYSADDCIVVKPIRGIAVYRNRNDDVVIRSQGDTADDEDNFAFVREENLPAVIAALKREGQQ